MLKLFCMYACVVITYGRLGINRYGYQPCAWSAEHETLFFLRPRLHLSIRSSKIGLTLPSRVSPSILHTQAESVNGAYSRISLLPPAFRDGVQRYRQPTSGQSRVSRITELRTYDVHHEESTDTEQAVLGYSRNGCSQPGNSMDPVSVRISFPTPAIGTMDVCDTDTNGGKNVY